jgi:hypothetical protein
MKITTFSFCGSAFISSQFNVAMPRRPATDDIRKNARELQALDAMRCILAETGLKNNWNRFCSEMWEVLRLVYNGEMARAQTFWFSAA